MMNAKKATLDVWAIEDNLSKDHFCEVYVPEFHAVMDALSEFLELSLKPLFYLQCAVSLAVLNYPPMMSGFWTETIALVWVIVEIKLYSAISNHIKSREMKHDHSNLWY